MQKKFVILDCENDVREANDESMWDTIDQCMNDIKVGMLDNGDDNSYLPWKIVHWDESKNKTEMLVHTRIKRVTRGIHLEKI
jgi:hypothetical protein